MSRSGYIDDLDQWAAIRWRGAVKSAIRGRRGQAFLREMLAALDAMPEKKLIAEKLEHDGEVCAIGAVGKVRGVDMSSIDPEDNEHIAAVFGIPFSLACEIMWENDEAGIFGSALGNVTSEGRYMRMRNWVASQILEDVHE